MKISDIREMKMPELHLELDRLRKHLFDLRAQSVTEKLENPHLLGDTRKDIARVLTVMRDRGEEGIEEKQIHLRAVAPAQARPKKAQTRN